MKLTEFKPTVAGVVNGALGIVACAVLVIAFPTVMKGAIDQVIAAGKRVPIHAGDRCHRCQRLITERSVAAEGIGPASVGVRKFRNVACMLKYLNESNENLDVLVVDRTTGRFVRPQRARFVRTTIDTRTGEEGYVAFHHAWSASRLAARERTAVVDWETVQAMERAHSLAQ